MATTPFATAPRDPAASTPEAVELGLDTFGDVTAGPDGRPLPHDQVLRDVVDEAVLADQVGVDFMGVGEHHREDFAVSAPEVVLAAAAARTSRIRLGSAVTVLSSDDPVRVYQRFATLDAVSGGRAEAILGRGSFTESFPLFGQDLDDYHRLFDEKLALFARLRGAGPTAAPVTWGGTVDAAHGATRPALEAQRVFPTTAAPLVTWVGVGGSPESVVRAARHGLRLMLAIIGGDPRRFAPYVRLYREMLERFGHADQPVGIHSMGHVAETDEAARAALWPAYQGMRDRIGRERGWGPTSRAEFEREAAHGSLYVGGPETVARRIAATVRALGVQRFDLKYSAGSLAHPALMRSVELYGTRVVPRVRELLADAPALAAA